MTDIHDTTSPPSEEQQTSNEYWDAVRDLVRPDRAFGGPTVDYFFRGDQPHIKGIRSGPGIIIDRMEYCSRWSWTITDPDTVDFVTSHAGRTVLDPLAGSGWWAHLLRERGITVIACDANPPKAGSKANKWHQHGAWIDDIALAHGADAAWANGAAGTLLLSWPPYDTSDGVEIVNAYRRAGGKRIIYIGEGEGGCCGSDEMFTVLGDSWIEVDGIRPVQWFGMHDYVTVYEPRPLLRTEENR